MATCSRPVMVPPAIWNSVVMATPKTVLRPPCKKATKSRCDLRSAEAPQRRAAVVPRALARLHRRLRERLERAPDLLIAVARRQNPAVGDSHVAEHLPEVGVAVVDAHGGDDVLFLLQHVLD